MAGNLWKMTTIKNAGKLTKGMSVEILVPEHSKTGSVNKLSRQRSQIRRKPYRSCHCGYANFEIEKLN